MPTKTKSLPPFLGLSDVAELFGVSKQLTAKWAQTWPDWPAPAAVLRGGTFWWTPDVLAVAKAHERQPGSGPRPSGDPRPPSVQRKAEGRATKPRR